jgi:hypothetical protein
MVSGAVPFACSTMVIDEVPGGTSNVTTSPTVCVPRGVPAGLSAASCTPALGTTGFVHAGCATGHVPPFSLG